MSNGACANWSATSIPSTKVNTEVLRFYWELGRDIVERQMENTYGSRFFSQLSTDLQRELPDIKGFSPTNIKYCKYFYELYSPLLQIRQQLVDDFSRLAIPPFAEQLFSIPWDHHRRIIDRCKSNPAKAIFFLQKTKENGWSRAVLLNHLSSDLYERSGRVITKLRVQKRVRGSRQADYSRGNAPGAVKDIA